MIPEYTWDEQRPANGQKIEAYSVPLKSWEQGVYWDDGIDGVIEFSETDVCEIEEYGADTITKWRAT